MRPVIVPLVLVFSAGAGCATLVAPKRQELAILGVNGATFGSDTVVTDNGAPADFEHLTEDGLGVIVSPRTDHELRISSGGRTATLHTGTHVGVGYVLLDLFLTGPIGIVVDWSTHAWRRAAPIGLRLSWDPATDAGR